MANPINVPGTEMGKTAYSSTTGSMVAATLSRDSGDIPSTMTKAEVLSRFANHDLMDEIEVGEKYLDYYYAIKAECPETAKACLEMSHEEFTHAKAQKELLKAAGYTMTEDGHERYKAFEHRLEEAFRG